MKKLIALVLMVVLVFTMYCAAVYAVDDPGVDSIKKVAVDDPGVDVIKKGTLIAVDDPGVDCWKPPVA